MPDEAKQAFNSMQESLYLKYRYGSLNYHLIQKFIVQTGRKTSLKNIWRSGIYFPRFSGNHAIVHANHADDSINIRVQGPQANYLMSAIRYEFKNISQRGNVEVLVSSDGVHYASHKDIKRQISLFKDWAQVDIDRLLVWDVDGRARIEVKKLIWALELVPEEQVSFSEIPDVVQNPKKEKLVFISYAKENLKVVEKLDKLLGPYKSENKLKIWYDRDIDQRKSFDDQIREKLYNADLFIAIISSDYLDSNKEYIRKEEEPRIIDRHKKEAIPVFPLLIEKECMWKASTFSNHDVNFPNKEKVYDLNSGIKEFIELVVEELEKTEIQ